jgi:hypothetical protein
MDTNGARTRTALLDLPDELIDQILAEVKWGAPAPTFELDGLQFYENLTRNTDDIRHVRLTCRRLASRASVLLLPVASVSFSDPSSVDRLEQIAGHGALAPYVKAVHVRLDHYEADLANDIRLLAGYLVRHMIQGPRAWVQALVGAVSPTTVLPLPGCKTKAVWDQIIHDWRQLGRRQEEGSGSEDADSASYDTPAPEAEDEKSESMRLLRREHAEYKRRYEAQQRLGQSFGERIGQALARIPKATRLILDDGPDPHAPRPATEEWLITPTSWATVFALDRGSPPIETLFGLPAAVHRAGVELTALRIHRLQLPDDFPLWLPPKGQEDLFYAPDYPPPREIGELRAACGSLRVFEFTPGYQPDYPLTAFITHLRWPGAATRSGPGRDLFELFELILASRNLRQVRVDLQMINGGNPSELAMSSPAWPHIQILHLQAGYLEVAALDRFLSATAGTLTQLYLDDMRLQSAAAKEWPHHWPPFSWATTLDMVRTHRRPREHGGGGDGSGDNHISLAGTSPAQEPLAIRIRRPRRAEFDDESLSKSDMAQISALFEPDGDGGGDLSPVDRFLQGLSDRNPLVEAGKTKSLYYR